MTNVTVYPVIRKLAIKNLPNSLKGFVSISTAPNYLGDYLAFGPFATRPHLGQALFSHSSIQNSCLQSLHLILILATCSPPYWVFFLKSLEHQIDFSIGPFHAALSESRSNYSHSLCNQILVFLRRVQMACTARCVVET
jgi:hypothetical protein